MISSHHHDQSIDTNTSKPEMITFYNRYKGGVDTLDNLVESYTCKRKSNKWPFVVFMFIIDLAAYNAFVIGKTK